MSPCAAVIKTESEHQLWQDCKETEKIFNRQFSRKFPHTIQRRAMQKLWMIDASPDLNSLRIPPSNQLEALKGDRKGQYSIRINDQ